MIVRPKDRPPHTLLFILLAVLAFFPIIYALAVIRAEWFGWVLGGFSFAMLLWMRTTKLWRGWRIALCFGAAFLVALTGLELAKPEKNVSLMGQIGRETLRVFMGLPLDKTVRTGEAFDKTKLWEPPDGYELTVATLPNARMELLTSLDEGSNYAVLQLHGGAFVGGLNDLYRTFAVRYSRLCGGAMVATLDYRLYPAYGYPSQQEDAMDAWNYLTQRLGYPADRIICVGDSAGGNLVLSLSLRLRDEGRPLPRALVLMSPWADLSNAGPSHLYNARQDPTFNSGADNNGYDIRPVGVDSTYADGLDTTDPYLSPSYGDYAGFPSMLLQVGGYEVLLSDSQSVYDSCQKHGVDCTFTIYPGMFHVFQGALNLLPESQNAWEEIGNFLTRVLQ
ncbi:MAG: steryl acetyl hydrolase [Clostridia bacterium]|nr:steryl acetyl hydrolase [Clostridia bacterium]